MKERRLFINEQIRATKIRLIGPDGSQKGIVERKKALEEARKAGLDLVEVACNNGLSICRIMDYGRYRYEQNKKLKDGKKNQKIIQVKEIKLRPNIDENDFKIKIGKARKFLEKGQKIKVVLNFRGREIVHSNIGMNIITKFADALKDISLVERRPYLEGKRITMVIVPSRKDDRRQQTEKRNYS